METTPSMRSQFAEANGVSLPYRTLAATPDPAGAGGVRERSETA